MVHDPPNGHSTRQKVINIWVFNVVGRIRVLPKRRSEASKRNKLDWLVRYLQVEVLTIDYRSVSTLLNGSTYLLKYRCTLRLTKILHSAKLRLYMSPNVSNDLWLAIKDSRVITFTFEVCLSYLLRVSLMLLLKILSLFSPTKRVHPVYFQENSHLCSFEIRVLNFTRRQN